MEASLKLLNQYVKVDDFTAEEIAAKLTSIGHEVDVYKRQILSLFKKLS